MSSTSRQDPARLDRFLEALNACRQRASAARLGRCTARLADLLRHCGARAGLARLERAGTIGTLDRLERLVDALLGQPSHRLAVYGSLAPGAKNAWVLRGLRGRWLDGSVRGTYHARGWGLTAGHPALRWTSRGHPRPVRVLSSAALPRHWARIDAFEGPDYLRILVPVQRGPERVLLANLYGLAPRSGSRLAQLAVHRRA